MKQLAKILILIFVLSFSLSLVTAEGNFTELQNEIFKVENSTNKTLILDKDYKFNGISDNSLQITSDNFILDGRNHTIDGNKQIQIFKISGDNVSFKNINIINGATTNNPGGAIFASANTTLNLINTNFDNNIGISCDGGAIFGWNINIINSSFTNNVADTRGGAICANDIINVYNSIFTNNQGGRGGAIFEYQKLNIYNSTFTNNKATDSGGGIYSFNELNVYNSSFNNNDAPDGGAIIVFHKGNVFSSFFKGNSVIYNGSSIFFNTLGEGVVNNNVILDENPIYNSGNNLINLDFNWWGDNSNPTNKIIGSKTLNSYYMMNLTSNPIIGNNYSFNYIFKLNKGNAPLLLPKFIVDFTINNMNITSIDGRENKTIFTKINDLNNTINVISNNHIILNLSFTANLITIETNNLTKYYINNSQFQVKVVDNEQKPIANSTITMNINGVSYYRTTNINGIAILNIKLFPGEYIITTKYNNQTFINTVKVLSTLIWSVSNQINVLNEIGNPLQGAIVSFNINGIIYNGTSDINGLVRLNINLDPGSYIATATWNKYSTSKNITVNP